MRTVKSVFVIVFLVFAISSASPVCAETVKKLALVIGNSAYQQFRPLKNPRNDAEGVSQSLEKAGFDVIKLLDASKSQQKNSVKVFLEQLNGYDVGLFYFAGHGIAINGQNYLIPVDATLRNRADVERELLLVDSVLGASLQGKQMLVFLDACRDNPFGGKAVFLDDAEVSRGLVVSRRVKEQETGGLSRLESGNQNLFVAFATQPGNVALDGGRGSRNSPFSKGLLLHLNERLEVREMMTKVRASVANETNFRQIPWEQNSLLKPVYLAGLPDLGKMQTFHIANVTKVNRSWGYVVADLVSERRPEVGMMVQIKAGGKKVEAKVGKVMSNAISIIPQTWEQDIQPGAQVIQEEFSN